MIWNYTDTSFLTMKKFDDIQKLKSYLNKIKDEDLFAYGMYQIEAEGKSLFSKIEGDENSIMGLPVKKIIEYLKNLNEKILSNRKSIEHSLSPLIHNFWIKKHNLDATYEKKIRK